MMMPTIDKNIEQKEERFQPIQRVEVGVGEIKRDTQKTLLLCHLRKGTV